MVGSMVSGYRSREIYIKATHKNYAKTEKKRWYYLRANRLEFKFKRQFSVGMYIVDFICLKKYLIIELDGGQHL